MALAIPQSTSAGYAFAPTPVLPAFASAVGTGSIIIAGFIIGINGTADTMTSVTDNFSNTYTRIGSQHIGADYLSVEVWAAVNVTGGSSFVVTGHESTSDVVGAIAYEITGAATSSATDLFVTKAQDYGTAAFSMSITTTNAADALIAFCGADSLTTWTSDATWANTKNTNTNLGFLAQTKILSATGANTWSISSGASKGLAGLIVAFKEAAATTTTTTTVAAANVKGQFFPFMGL